MTFKRKETFKNTLFEDYTTCNQDHSQSRYLLEDDLAQNIRRAKATCNMDQSISARKLHPPSSSPRNPSSHSAKSYSSINYQGCKKSFQRSAPSPRRNCKWN